MSMKAILWKTLKNGIMVYKNVFIGYLCLTPDELENCQREFMKDGYSYSWLPSNEIIKPISFTNSYIIYLETNKTLSYDTFNAGDFENGENFEEYFDRFSKELNIEYDIQFKYYTEYLREKREFKLERILKSPKC